MPSTTPKPARSLGPLQDGSHVVIVGGGPGGVGAALALTCLAIASQRKIEITLFEGKVFAGERHFNQCSGVLSPPIVDILQDSLGVKFPHHLVQRQICAYVLHSDQRSILLESSDPPAYAVRRIQFDDYLLEQARMHGIRIVTGRVTDLEFHSDRVIVYGENGNTEGDVVVGAFGLDYGTAQAFQKATPYQPPRFLSSIVTKIHPGMEFMEQFGNSIHAFLPSDKAIEFGAITPKGNHLAINIAGDRIDAATMNRFLSSRSTQSVLPHIDCTEDTADLRFFKGRFPISQARNFSGDRYVIVGDAAGLVRPFKGKGVNSALLSGAWSADTMMSKGISAVAFDSYHRACREITSDLIYGKTMRMVANLMSKGQLLDLVLHLANRDAHLRQALFDAVSAHKSYRAIVHSLTSPSWLARTALSLPKLALRQPNAQFQGDPTKIH